LIFCEVLVMTGMLTGDRMVRLEVSGMCQQSVSRTSNYTVTVPYSSMAQTMKNIMRRGGKVTGVHTSSTAAATPSPAYSSTVSPNTASPNTENSNAGSFNIGNSNAENHNAVIPKPSPTATSKKKKKRK
jgi:CpcD/allophycocyanin linker domain